MSKTSVRYSLKTKLLLVSLAVLIIPYMGFDYLRQMEAYLRDSLEATMVDTAFAIAGGLNNERELFSLYTTQQANSLYIHELNHTVQLDGYTDDWMSYLDWSDTYQAGSSEDSFRLIVSQDERYLYLFFQVNDETLIYPDPDSNDELNSDHLIMSFTDQTGLLTQYYFVPDGPGEIRPFRYESRFDEYGVENLVQRSVTNISAVWQPESDGYNIEIKIPAYVVGDHLGFILRNYDGKKFQDIETAGKDTFFFPNRLLRSSKQIENIILTQGRSDGRRTWVLDQFGQVLASEGSLKRIFPQNAFNILYTFLLPPAYDQFQDDLAGASRLRGSEVLSALNGKSEIRWRSSPDGRAVIVSAATPVWLDNKVVGAVVVEETTNNIQIMQRQVLANLFNKTLLIFLIVITLLILFAGRLSARLIRLNRNVKHAIDEYGRVSQDEINSEGLDEIGQLSNSFNDMLNRLQQYHHYLEGIASNLSHELKTPMAIVQTSLERLQREQDETEKQKAMAAAMDGLNRLQTLLSRLGEAASLQQAISDASRETVCLNDFMRDCFNGYQLAYPDHEFKLILPQQTIHYEINRDLFYQMLDKLISNAVDFAKVNTPIEIELKSNQNNNSIVIRNQGPILPENMADELFNSMVSIRHKQNKQGLHLGLGLYLARLIAEFHLARLSASNIDGAKGVAMTISLQNTKF